MEPITTPRGPNRFFRLSRNQLAEAEAGDFFINVFSDPSSFDGRHYVDAQALDSSRDNAVAEAESCANTYQFTITRNGVIDLRPEFSEQYQRETQLDEAADRKIDEAKHG
jgi:hypothetical protein